LSKLVLDDFELDPMYIIGIYTNMEAYRLAFYLNQALNIHLKRAENDMAFYDRDGEETNYPFFLFYNEKEDVQFTLIENKISIEEQVNDNNVLNLFANLPLLVTKEKILVPEESAVDFFFKIETELLEVDDFDHLIPLIKKIPQIATVRYINYEGLKNKNNLIF